MLSGSPTLDGSWIPLGIHLVIYTEHSGSATVMMWCVIWDSKLAFHKWKELWHTNHLVCASCSWFSERSSQGIHRGIPQVHPSVPWAWALADTGSAVSNHLSLDRQGIWFMRGAREVLYAKAKGSNPPSDSTEEEIITMFNPHLRCYPFSAFQEIQSFS